MSDQGLILAIVDFHGMQDARDSQRALQACASVRVELISSEARAFPEGTAGILLPGGASYGDYIRPGALARTAPIAEALLVEAEKGTPMLGIGNGFQVLCELGLLPGTLLLNEGGRGISRDVFLRVMTRRSSFFEGIDDEVLCLPVAHRFGRYTVSASELAVLRSKEQVALCYCDEAGRMDDAFNPNGSVGHIAGVLDEHGRILGLMARPERRVLPWASGQDGHIILKGLVAVASVLA